MSQLSILGVTQRKKLSINLTTLNTILSQSDEIVSIYESNQAGDSRKRLTKARNLEIKNHLFDTFKLNNLIFDTFKFYGSK